MAFERPTFSPLWHRVRALKPRLRPHVQITRQHYRGRRWHVVHDPTSNHFYRLSPVAHEMVALLDGNRTVEDTWNAVLGNHGDAAPTQGEVIELLGQMYNTNLLAIDLAPETEQLLRRGRERTKRRIASQAIGIMYFRLRLFNPDAILAKIEPVLRPLLNVWGFALWLFWIGFALYRILPRWDELSRGFADAIAPSNWFWLSVVFIVIKLIHETGHGVLTRRFGGQVPEFGVMMLVLFPSPYVDASACWAFPSKWRRMAVGAGGMIFELTVAAAMAHVWLATGQGQLIHQLAYAAMLTASVTTVMFNANPLMRFDGYYILSDLLEVPNLMQRSMKYLQHLAQVYLYRVENSRPPSTSRGELAILLIYGLAALAYRLFLFTSITLFMMGKLFAIGLILAVWTAAAWFLIPLGKFVHWLSTSPQLAEFRPRAILTSLLLIAGGLVLIGVVPMPDHRKAAAVVESVSSKGVYFGTDGFIVTAHVRVGDRVKAGDPIVTCESQDLLSRIALVEAQLAEFRAAEQEHTAKLPTLAALDRGKISNHEDLLARLNVRRSQLVVRAPQDGIVVPGFHGVDPQSVVGSYAKRGQGLCDVVEPAQTRIAIVLPSDQVSGEDMTIDLRAVCDPHTLLHGSGIEVIGPAQKQLPHPALSYLGGGTIETDSTDKTGLVAKRGVFIVRVNAAADEAGNAWIGVPGERVRAQLRLSAKPLLTQWIGRLYRIIQERGPDI